eukprot:GABV01000122.1.p1 GENE.GABV01000122.1~~GABV01000122.1.p1  ORF type:complete len:360 (-),score=103.13 GABV01000122.1:66-1145(-)
MSLLKNYCRRAGIKTSIIVGLIGYPNVGKSSVINSLKRSKAAGVANKPGFTTSIQSIKLDHEITLLDSPGVIMSSDPTSDPHLALRSAVNISSISDPADIVASIYRRCFPEQLQEIYEIAAFSDVDEFLRLVAHKRGALKARSVPNISRAARIVLQDWSDGKIPYFCTPPKGWREEHQQLKAAQQAQNQKNSVPVFRASWATEFDLDKLLESNHSEAARVVRTIKPADLVVQMQSEERNEGEIDMQDDDMNGGGSRTVQWGDSQPPAQEEKVFSFMATSSGTGEEMEAEETGHGHVEGGTGEMAGGRKRPSSAQARLCSSLPVARLDTKPSSCVLLWTEPRNVNSATPSLLVLNAPHAK